MALPSASSSTSPASVDAWDEEVHLGEMQAQEAEAGEQHEVLRRERDTAEQEVARLKVDE